MSNTASLKKEYQDRIVPALTKEFGYKSVMQVPVLKKIVINQGLGMATADKKLIDIAISELSTITGQKAVATVSKKDISNFKLRKKMPIGVMVTLRREQMYEFLERLVRVALPRIRDFKGIESKLDGRGNYTLGIQEQIIFPEINIDNITKILGLRHHRHPRFSVGYFGGRVPGTNKELPLRSGYKRRGAILLLSTKRRNSPEYECLFLNEQDGNLV